MTNNPRRMPLVAEVATVLREQIDSGEVGGSGWLPAERTLAPRLGVSRNVLREAVKQLQSQGLLEARHGVGVRVARNPYKPIVDAILHEVSDTRERLLELLRIRLLVEPEIARLAARNVTSELVDELSAAQDVLRDSPDAARAADGDLAFHRALAKAARNRTLLLILDSLAEIGRESRIRTLGAYGRERAHAHHQVILECVRAGDESGAQAAMRKNLDVTLGEVESLTDVL